MDTTGAIYTLPLFLDRVAALSAELFGRDSAYPEEPVPTPTPRPGTRSRRERRLVMRYEGRQ